MEETKLSEDGLKNGGTNIKVFRPEYRVTYNQLEADKLSNRKGNREDSPIGAMTSLCTCCKYHQEMGGNPNGAGFREDEGDSMGICCNADWRDFTEYTTLHGLRYIWHLESSWSRRILWLTLSLVCVSIMMYQIIDRAIYFYEWPVTVNVKINYNDTLEFPSLTICNQNAFRATVAASMGRYQLISQLFHDNKPFKLDDLERYNATNVTFAELYSRAGHRIEDIILSCSWRGQPCGPENFTEVATGHGKCYTFNDKDADYLFVDSPGAKEGLSLTLNIEQYEYMPGPNDAAGIKILLHHSHQFPNVRELGMVLAAGTHSLVGMKIFSIKNLPKPHGQCSSPKPRHFKEYATETCHVECQASLLKDQCGCRLYHMPDLGDTPVCTLWQYYSCYTPNIGKFRQKAKSGCWCPVPCRFDVFEPTVSYATSSPVVTGRLLASTNRSNLKAKYDAARDVTHRMRPEKRDSFANLIKNLQQSVAKVRSLIMTEIRDKLNQQRGAVRQVTADIDTIVNETSYLYEYQAFVVRKCFNRGRDAMNERTFSNVAFAMQEFVFDIEASIRLLAGNSAKYDSTRKVIFLEVIRRLDGKIDITQRAYQNYTQFLTALQTGSPIFNYRFKDEPSHDNIQIVPLPLFHEVLNKTKVEESTRKLKIALLNAIKILHQYKQIANQSFLTGVHNETAVFVTGINYLQNCRRYLQRRDEFLYEMPDRFESFFRARADELERYKRAFNTASNKIMIQATTLSESHDRIKQWAFGEIDEGIRLAWNFLLDGSVSKNDVARQFLTDEVHETKNALKTFSHEVSSRGHEAFDEWTNMRKLAVKIWSMAIADVNLHVYYKYINKSNVLVNKTQKLSDIEKAFDGYRKQLDLRRDMHHVYSEFPETLSAVLKEMAEFKAAGELNSQFLKDNILQMSVFYKELSYEQITQQEAYDIFALLCDIGGSMGLFVGASVISIFEILDLIGFTYVMRALRGRRS